jgi:hypothetical protein
MWFGAKSGAVGLFPFISEFIARAELIAIDPTATTMASDIAVLT